MVQAIIYLDDELNKKIEIISDKFNISKHSSIIKILNEYKIKDEKKA
jgi:hypothetical protein